MKRIGRAAAPSPPFAARSPATPFRETFPKPISVFLSAPGATQIPPEGRTATQDPEIKARRGDGGMVGLKGHTLRGEPQEKILRIPANPL